MKKAPISLFIVDDQSLYNNDLKEEYSDVGKYAITVFSSLQKLADHLSLLKRPKAAINIAVVSLKTDNEKTTSPNLTENLLLKFPYLYIIKITDGKELPKEESYKPTGNLIFVKRNVNTLLRIDNGIKLIIGRRTLEIKEKQRDIARWLVVTSIAIFIVAVLLFRILYPGIFYF